MLLTIDVGNTNMVFGIYQEKKLLGALRDGGASQSAALLEALRPLLRLEKQEKLDRAIRAVRLMGAARTVSKTIEL